MKKINNFLTLAPSHIGKHKPIKKSHQSQLFLPNPPFERTAHLTHFNVNQSTQTSDNGDENETQTQENAENKSQENNEEGDPSKTTPPAEAEDKTDWKTESEKHRKEASSWKEKFSHSSRESQVLSGKLKELENRQLAEPTEAELKKEFPEWDDMTDREKSMATRTYKNERLFKKQETDFHDFKSNQTREKDIRGTLAENPDLDEETFRAYIDKPTHKDISLGLLAKACLQDFPKETKTTAKKKPANPKNGLEKAKGGGNPKASKDIDPEELKKIRENDPKRYRRMLESGEIDV